MRDDIDGICERIGSAQRRAAARIFLSLTAAHRHEVMVRMGERSRAAAKDSAEVEQAVAAKKAATGGDSR